MSKTDGGAAFPVNPEAWPRQGMTLRDYFAAKAMQALLAISPHSTLADVASAAYRMADEMLAER